MIQKFFNTIRRIGSQIREKRKEKTRSPKWAHMRDEFLEKHPICAACGSKEHLQVHHVKPFHLHPELELDFQNLITLCMDKNECHLLIGHGGSYKCFNPNVREDSSKFYSTALKSEKMNIVENAKKNRLK